MKNRYLIISLMIFLSLTIFFANTKIVQANNEIDEKILSNAQEKVVEEINLEEINVEEIKGFKEESKDGLSINSKKSLDKFLKRKTGVKAAVLSGDLTWKLEEGVLTISGKGDMNDFEYTSDLSKMPPWFNSREEINKIVIEEGVTKIGKTAFFACYNVVEVIIPSTLTKIDDYAFVGTAIEEITLQASVKTLGTGVFARCTNLKTFTAYGLSIIPFQTFYLCTNLTNVFLDEGLIAVYRSGFYGCLNLKEIILPNSTYYVHSIAFPSTTQITCKSPNMRKYGVNGYRYLQDIKIKGDRKYSYAYEVLKIVNQERKKQGLPALKMDESLLETAMVRAAENAVCFSHTRPDGSICFDLSDKMIAENVAIGQKTAKQVMKEWMNSSGHKANILSENAKTIGIGCFVNNGVYCWAQAFGDGNNKSDCSKPKDTSKKQKISLAIDPFTEAITETGVVYKTSIQQYSYKFIMKIEKGIIEKKKTTNAKVYLKNAGFQQASAFVDPSTFNWSSRHKKTATVSSKGKITGKSNGIATISAKVEYGNFKLQITVGKNSKKPDKMKISSAKAKKGKKMTLSWKKNSSVTGYQIRYSTNKKFTKDTTKTVNIDKSSKASKTINNLEKGKKYYVQLRAYKKVKIDGKKQKLYGSWSTKKTITAKK